MRFLLWHHIQNARESLRGHRLRSFLTMLGITIGVASITAILALGAGAGKIVGDQVESLGGTLALVRPGIASPSGAEQLAQFSTRQQYTASTLTYEDLETIRGIDGIKAAAPLAIISGAVEGNSKAPNGTPIVVTTPELMEVNEIVLRDGQFLDTSLTVPTAVIGAQLSIDLFGTEQSIGKTVTIKGESFTIVGIMKRTHQPINYNGVDFDGAVLIDREQGENLQQGGVQIQQINFRTNSVSGLGSAIEAVNNSLRDNHLGQADFSVLSGDEVARPTSQLFSAIATFATAVAAISLIVGGVGIMNSMLVGVSERTREIGIRKALGASNSDIVSQFLIESLALSIGGGILGFLFGYIIAYGVSLLLPFDPAFTWFIVLIAALLSLVVGVIFGLYPAVRAALKDPISALRQYD